jgi:hypothetical protein
MRRLAATLACCTLPFTLLACGSDDDGDAASDLLDQIEQEIGTEIDVDAGSGPDAGDGPSDPDAPLPEPEFALTGDVDPPDGWVEDPANCRSDDESGPPLFAYHVPSEWDRTGSGYGGSGGAGGSGDHTYELPEGLTVEVEIDSDGYADAMGTPADGSGQPWETWDYDITSYSDAGEETHRATYDEVDPVEIDGESFDLWRLDQAQSDLISASEYKLRIVYAQVPYRGVEVGLRPESATVTITWDADDGELDEAVARDLLGSFRLDECARELIVEQLELIHGVEW